MNRKTQVIDENCMEEEEEEEEEEEDEEWVWSWGAGTDGQLGTGGADDQHWPQHFSFSPFTRCTISLIACGGAHAIALLGGKVLTWGRGTHGQLGHGDLKNCLKPKPLEFFEQIVICHVSAGWNHSGFVSESGFLFTCGDGSFGQLGHGDYQCHSSPVKVKFFLNENVEQVACGMRHSLILSKGLSGQSVYGVGSGRHGQLGSSVSNARKCVSVPEAIKGFKDEEMSAVFANGEHSALLSANGHLYIWGRGFGGGSDYYHPQLLPLQMKFSQVALGWNHALLLTDFGEVFMLGAMLGGRQENLKQQVPFCRTSSTSKNTEICGELMPVIVAGLDGVKVIHIAAGAEHSALVTHDGKIMTWGWGEHGQLGLGDMSDHTIPQTLCLASNPPDAHTCNRVYCGSGFTIGVGKTSMHIQR